MPSVDYEGIFLYEITINKNIHYRDSTVNDKIIKLLLVALFIPSVQGCVRIPDNKQAPEARRIIFVDSSPHAEHLSRV